MKIKIRFLIRRISVLKKAIFNGKPVKIVSIWECDWERQKKVDEDVKDFLEKNPVIERLKPRDAFFWWED
jgi:hypothetical protein